MKESLSWGLKELRRFRSERNDVKRPKCHLGCGNWSPYWPEREHPFSMDGQCCFSLSLMQLVCTKYNPETWMETRRLLCCHNKSKEALQIQQGNNKDKIAQAGWWQWMSLDRPFSFNNNTVLQTRAALKGNVGKRRYNHNGRKWHWIEERRFHGTSNEHKMIVRNRVICGCSDFWTNFNSFFKTKLLMNHSSLFEAKRLVNWQSILLWHFKCDCISWFNLNRESQTICIKIKDLFSPLNIRETHFSGRTRSVRRKHANTLVDCKNNWRAIYNDCLRTNP